jgi:uncharacterized membrane protein YqaE (UPF0057 family)
MTTKFKKLKEKNKQEKKKESFAVDTSASDAAFSKAFSPIGQKGTWTVDTSASDAAFSKAFSPIGQKGTWTVDTSASDAAFSKAFSPIGQKGTWTADTSASDAAFSYGFGNQMGERGFQAGGENFYSKALIPAADSAFIPATDATYEQLLKPLSKGITERVGGGLKTAGETVGSGLKTAGETVGSGLKTAGETVGGGLKTAGETVGGGLKTAGETVGGGFKTAGETVGSGLKTAGETVGSGLKTAGLAIGDYLGYNSYNVDSVPKYIPPYMRRKYNSQELAKVNVGKIMAGTGPISMFVIKVLDFGIDLIINIATTLGRIFTDGFEYAYSSLLGEYQGVFPEDNRFGTYFSFRFLRTLITILTPPVGVFMAKGVKGWFNILICMMLCYIHWVIGILYAFVITFKNRYADRYEKIQEEKVKEIKKIQTALGQNTTTDYAFVVGGFLFIATLVFILYLALRYV